MTKKHGIICIAVGTALLIAALSLVFYNVNENKRSGESAKLVLEELKSAIPDTPEPTEPTEPDGFYSEYETPAEPVVEEMTMTIDDHGYIGVISIPSLRLELPVMSEWSYPNLKISPCRYKGTASGGDLIIAAHNYRSHFGRLNELAGGDEIIFTEVSGRVHRYEADYTYEINGRDVEKMEFDSAENWDLTLFTCTLSGQSRVTVRAVEVTDK